MTMSNFSTAMPRTTSSPPAGGPGGAGCSPGPGTGTGMGTGPGTSSRRATAMGTGQPQPPEPLPWSHCFHSSTPSSELARCHVQNSAGIVVIILLLPAPLRVQHRGTDPSPATSACTRPCPILLTTLTGPDAGGTWPSSTGVPQVGSRGRVSPPGQDPPLSPLGPSALSSVPAQGSAPALGSGHDTAATGALISVPGALRGAARGAVPAGAAAGRAILRAAGALGGTDGPRGG